MTPAQALVMQRLCTCVPGKGCMLPLDMHGAATRCIDKGWAYAINGGFGDVFIATTAGRAAYAKSTKEEWNLP